MPRPSEITFADYKSGGQNWITQTNDEYYPDTLTDACLLYEPVLILFGQLIKSSESSLHLFHNISQVPEAWMRVQLSRVFGKYVSPHTPADMIKRKSTMNAIIERYAKTFKSIEDVRSAFMARPMPDEALCALLWDYKISNPKGYNLKTRLFDLLQSHFPELPTKISRRPETNVPLHTVLEDYPNEKRIVDFLLHDTNKLDILAVGLAHYYPDKNRAQDDRQIDDFWDAADEIVQFAQSNRLTTKLIIIIDGPGLVTGTMWDEYARLEQSWPGRIKVVTLRMIPERITYKWLVSEDDDFF